MLISKFSLKNYSDLNSIILKIVLINLTLKVLWLMVYFFVTANIQMLIKLYD